MVNINLQIQKKDLWLLSAIMIFLIGVGYVVAIGSGNYQVQGHDFSELQKCSEGKILKIASGVWGCSDDIDTNTVSGLVIAGGIVRYGHSSSECDRLFGGASCSGTLFFADPCGSSYFHCPSGSTSRWIATFVDTVAEYTEWTCLCIRN